ncbi:zinc-ribbon domain-containing protein [Aquicoccus sp.]|uniref:zinc-ribbon domain-containing protein n=1 Tax=Aquicoccus sp. TaxID=2055851 RepID=UPI0035664937
MRLICPNCGAQYEVPDDVIPETGRDVQCSNCGDTWFQKHPEHDAELAEELGQPLDDTDWTDSDAEPTEDWHDQDRSHAGAAASPEAAWPDEIEEPTAPAPQVSTGDAPEDPLSSEEARDDEAPLEPGPAPQPRELPEDVREVLREEAKREREARAAAASGGLETQPDLGLEESPGDASQREREARLRMARMRGMSEKEAMTAAGLSQLSANASRRDLLPDIDEINSTLRKNSERQPTASTEPDEAAAPATQQSGFSRGFSYMLLLFALLLALYVFSGKLAEMVPQLGPLLETYVDWVNRARLWLDSQVAALVQWLDSMTSEAAAPAGDGGT